MSHSIEIKRHSLEHVFVLAMKRLFPNTFKLGVGPVIENGFYQDFDFIKDGIKESDFEMIQKEMEKIIAEEIPFEQSIIEIDEAINIFKHFDEQYKLELLNDIKSRGTTKIAGEELQEVAELSNNGKVIIYKLDIHTDLCRGPHVKNTSELKGISFKLDRVAGAYWRGDENNKMMTRVYFIAFGTKEELAQHYAMQEEAKKRDHRVLGKKLELFHFDDQVGPGLPLWLPKGSIIVEELEKLAKETELKMGYKRVRTPHIAKEELYITSGHLPYYEDGMYPAMDYDGTKYYLKAMNCPHHHKIFDSKIRSYREMPLRLAEYGHCYRHEDSGSLFGLMRVRSLCMNDAHIYCSEEQFESEFDSVNKLYLKYFKIFGIEKYVMRLSLHSKEKLGKKYVNEPELWLKTEDMVRNTFNKLGIPYIEVPDEAAFYGPKIDVQVWSVIGREFTLATNQVDFAVPKRFNLKYTDPKGEEKTPLCIHRAPLGTHERFIGFLIEHYAGSFPLWISPIQVEIIPISNEKHLDYSKLIYEKLLENDIRSELDDANETMGNKIRKATEQKVNYMLIIGEKEIKENSVSVRGRDGKDYGIINIDKFITILKNSISQRSNEVEFI